MSSTKNNAYQKYSLSWQIQECDGIIEKQEPQIRSCWEFFQDTFALVKLKMTNNYFKISANTAKYVNFKKFGNAKKRNR